MNDLESRIAESLHRAGDADDVPDADLAEVFVRTRRRQSARRVAGTIVVMGLLSAGTLVVVGRGISDTFVAYLAGFALLGGSLALLIAFALAIIAKVRHERWTLLRLPLSAFPALVALAVVVEAVWME